MSEGTQKKSLTWILPAVVVLGLVLAILIPVSGATEAVVDIVARWFFAVFCTLYAIVQARVYFMFRRRRASLADSEGVPVAIHGAFTLVWAILAVAAIVYGITGVDGGLETAGWVTIVLLVGIQMLVLGRFDSRVRD